MNTLLSIVIPRYRETEKELFPLLSSIHGQVGIDHSVLEVIVATDGKENAPLEKEFFGLFDFPATQVTLETNSGPGAARQAGLDAASGKYYSIRCRPCKLFLAGRDPGQPRRLCLS